MKTLARKHKTSIRDVMDRLFTRQGNELGILYDAEDGKKCFVRMTRLRHIKSPAPAYGHSPVASWMSGASDAEPTTAFSPNRNDVLDRLRAGRCEACGAATLPVEIHHVRKMADMGDVSLFAFLKAARTRKRTVLCRPCHVAHHSGLLKARLDQLARASEHGKQA
jgi:RNA-directed DNA polymerase